MDLKTEDVRMGLDSSGSSHRTYSPLTNMVMNPQVPQKVGNFSVEKMLTSQVELCIMKSYNPVYVTFRSIYLNMYNLHNSNRQLFFTLCVVLKIN